MKTTEFRMCRDCFDTCNEKHADMKKALEYALVSIVSEYPKDDNRYLFAVEGARRFGLDLGEMT